MSATTIDVGEVPDLNEQQVDAVLAEALSAQFFELDVDGQLPRDPKDRKAAAAELVRQARLSYAVGNRSSGVTSLLFIAEVDQQPPIPDTESDTGGTDVSAEVDLSKQPDASLQKFEETLLNYPASSERDESLEQVRAVMRERGLATAEAPEANGNSVPSPEAEDAQPAEEPVQASGPSEDRKALEDRLTFSAMRAHGIDPSEIPSISDEQLRWIVEHPGGESTSAAPASAQESSPEEPQTIETTRMIVDRPPEQAPVAQEDPAVAEESSGSVISAEREELESQVTGPMLKAYGRGRVDVPGIGDHELRFMIENPEGRVTQEQLLAAKALDKDDTEGAAQAAAPESAIAETEPSSEDENPIIAEQSQQVEPVVRDREWKVEQVANATVAIPGPVEDRAQEIIDREHFPIPSDIETPPRMPNDMSKCSKDDVYSLHARFHAAEARSNWVLANEEEHLADLEKLLRGREVEVANALPKKDPEDARKRLTDAQRESMVAADEEVKSLKERIHKQAKIVRKLKVLRDSYHRDVERASRQLTRFTEEREGAR